MAYLCKFNEIIEFNENIENIEFNKNNENIVINSFNSINSNHSIMLFIFGSILF